MINANSISHMLLLVRLYFLKLANLESRVKTRMQKGTVENSLENFIPEALIPSIKGGTWWKADITPFPPKRVYSYGPF